MVLEETMKLSIKYCAGGGGKQYCTPIAIVALVTTVLLVVLGVLQIRAEKHNPVGTLHRFVHRVIPYAGIGAMGELVKLFGGSNDAKWIYIIGQLMFVGGSVLLLLFLGLVGYEVIHTTLLVNRMMPMPLIRKVIMFFAGIVLCLAWTDVILRYQYKNMVLLKPYLITMIIWMVIESLLIVVAMYDLQKKLGRALKRGSNKELSNRGDKSLQRMSIISGILLMICSVLAIQWSMALMAKPKPPKQAPSLKTLIGLSIYAFSSLAALWYVWVPLSANEQPAYQRHSTSSSQTVRTVSNNLSEEQATLLSNEDSSVSQA